MDVRGVSGGLLSARWIARCGNVALLLVACKEPAPPAVVEVRARSGSAPVVASSPASPAPAPGPTAVQIAPDARIGSGCFARSRRTGMVACVIGSFLPPVTGRRTFVLLRNDDGPDVRIDLGARERYGEPARTVVNGMLAADDFVALPGVPTKLAVGPVTNVGVLRVRVSEQHHMTDWVDDTLRPITVDQKDIALDIEAGTTPLHHDALFRAYCTSSRYEMRVFTAPDPFPGTLLVEAECTTEAEGTQTLAALCDASKPRCD